MKLEHMKIKAFPSSDYAEDIRDRKSQFNRRQTC